MSIPSPRRSVAPPALAWGEGSLRVAEVVRAQQSQLQAVIGRLEAGAADDVHQGRVAARRLRSILKTFAPLIDERWARMYRMDLRTAARVDDMSLEEVEAFLIKKALARHEGNARKAAEALGLSRSAFYRRLERYGL